MSSSSENPQRAPWRDLLDSQLKQTPGYEFTIATIGYDSQQRPVPRLRTCGCRGFFPELELHPKGQEAMDQQVEGGGNPSVYESDMLTFTTDARMEKLPQLESSGQAIEAVFWLKDLMTQWRIKGTAYAIGNPQGEDAEDERTSRQEIKKALRATNNDNSLSTWTWEKAVTKYFANHSPVARGWYPLIIFLHRVDNNSFGCILCVHGFVYAFMSSSNLLTSLYGHMLTTELRLFPQPPTRAAQTSQSKQLGTEVRAKGHRST